MSRIPVVVVLKCSENTVVETLSICSDCALTGEAWTRGGCVLRSSRWQSVFEPLTGGCALASDAVSSSVTTRYSVKNKCLKITKGMKKKKKNPDTFHRCTKKRSGCWTLRTFSVGWTKKTKTNCCCCVSSKKRTNTTPTAAM